MPAGEERRGDFLEVGAHGRESLVEAALDGLGELGAQLLELLQARLEVGALVGQLGQPLLLALVLLLRKRVDLSERLAAALEPLDPGGRAPRGLRPRRLGSGFLEAAARLTGLCLEPRALDVDASGALTGLGGHAPDLRLLPAEPPQLRGQLASFRRARIDPGAEGRLEALDGPSRSRQRRGQPLGERDERLERRRWRLLGELLGATLELLGLAGQGAAARVQLEQDRLGRLAREPELAAVCVVAVTLSS